MKLPKLPSLMDIFSFAVFIMVAEPRVQLFVGTTGLWLILLNHFVFGGILIVVALAGWYIGSTFKI